VAQELKFTTHAQQKFASNAELNTRAEKIVAEFELKLSVKLDKATFNEKVLELEKQIEKSGKKAANHASKASEMAQSVKKTVEENNKQIDELRDQLDSKLSREEGSRLWGNFSRFAVYDDLKELYQRCLPAISKFEDQLQDFVTDSAKLKLVVRRFDEVISTKASKF